MIEVIISAQNVTEYLRLLKLGYSTAWCGEGRLCMAKQAMEQEQTDLIISAQNLREYNRLRNEGYTVVWVGEGKICFAKRTAHWWKRSITSALATVRSTSSALKPTAKPQRKRSS